MREDYPNLKFQTGKGAAPAFWTPSSQTSHSRPTPLRCLFCFSLNTPGHPDHPSHTHWSPRHLSCSHWPSLRTLFRTLPLLLGVVVGVVVLDDVILTAE